MIFTLGAPLAHVVQCLLPESAQVDGAEGPEAALVSKVCKALRQHGVASIMSHSSSASHRIASIAAAWLLNLFDWEVNIVDLNAARAAGDARALVANSVQTIGWVKPTNAERCVWEKLPGLADT